MKLAQVVPFGRSLDEYLNMFALSSSELKSKSILGVGDGPASFNAEGTQIGANITSIDPIYQFSGIEIKQRFDAVVDDVINQIIASPSDWIWSYHNSPQALKDNRVKAIEIFLRDYEQGKQEQRYLTAELPKLDFQEQQFDLALCSHFLFLYSEHYNCDFHFESIKEMMRISKEVRIFPLLTLGLETSPYLNFIIEESQALGYSAEIIKVSYELQKGGDKMLVIQ